VPQSGAALLKPCRFDCPHGSPTVTADHGPGGRHTARGLPAVVLPSYLGPPVPRLKVDSGVQAPAPPAPCASMRTIIHCLQTICQRADTADPRRVLAEGLLLLVASPLHAGPAEPPHGRPGALLGSQRRITAQRPSILPDWRRRPIVDMCAMRAPGWTGVVDRPVLLPPGSRRPSPVGAIYTSSSRHGTGASAPAVHARSRDRRQRGRGRVPACHCIAR
jgi:hypothetical protein